MTSHKSLHGIGLTVPLITKHMAAMDGTSITYSDKSCEGRKKAPVSRSKHRAKKFESDPDAMHGPLIVKLTLKSQQPQRGT